MSVYDLVIDNASYIVTCNSNNEILHNYSIAINGCEIAAIAPAGQLEGKKRFDATGKAITPGLINTHTHLAMSLLRGWAEGVDLQGFLEKVWAAEGAIMDGPTAQLGTELGALESLLGGTTTALDMYLFPDSAHKGAVKVGLRHISGPIFFDFPGLDGMEWGSRIDFARRWPSILKEIGGPYVPTYLMPHATYTCSPEHLREIAELSQEIGANIHIHASENSKENDDVASKYGKTPTEILLETTLLDRHTIYGHGVKLSASDISHMAEKKSSVAHCPGSNLKLASGIADVMNYRKANVNVALGTDGCSSSNDLDMWVVMRLAALLISQTQGPEKLNASEIFRMATIDGAKAVGMENQIGSIESGKCADLIAIDLKAAHLIPIHDLFAQLIFAAGRSDVSDVWVDGEHVIAGRKSTKVDFDDLAARVQNRISTLGANGS